jgi:flagella basal body P-ring formation protein FlgA
MPFSTVFALPARAPALLRRGLCWLALGLAGLASGLPAAAQTPPAAPAASDVGAGVNIESSTRQWLDQEVAKTIAPSADTALRMEVSVGTLDARLRLAPCARVEPYVPTGMRLWGKTRLGLRCVDGPVRWNVFLPIQVKAFGPAWVARGPVVSGTTLAAADAVQAEVDWAEEPSPVLASASQWVGAVATRSLNAGQTLRQAMVRAPVAFEAGAMVRIVAQGAGFNVTADGQAVSPGVVGQQAKVRMDGGRMISGTVLDSHTVRVDI